ncbi:MAG: heme exporter protein CcmB, partial [Vicinamibacteria bacterium]
PSAWSVLAALVWKDLVAEWRTRETLLPMALFAGLILVVFQFSFSPGERIASLTPGFLWVSILFGAVLGLNRSFLAEKEFDALRGVLLAPIDRGWIFLGKCIANLAFLVTMEAFVLGLAALLLSAPVMGHLPSLVTVILLCTLGLAAVGTLFSVMATNTRIQEVMLPLLLFPIWVPVLLGGVAMTETILAGHSLSELSFWINLVLVYDGVFLVLGFLVFDWLIEE